MEDFGLEGGGVSDRVYITHSVLVLGCFGRPQLRNFGFRGFRACVRVSGLKGRGEVEVLGIQGFEVLRFQGWGRVVVSGFRVEGL